VIILRFHPLYRHERPQRRIDRQQPRAKPLRVAVPTAVPVPQDLQRFEHQRDHVLVHLRPAATRSPKQVPQLKNAVLHAQARLGQNLRPATTLLHLFPVPLEVRPAHLPLHTGTWS
jgi:hypothetical protein